MSEAPIIAVRAGTNIILDVAQTHRDDTCEVCACAVRVRAEAPYRPAICVQCWVEQEGIEPND